MKKSFEIIENTKEKIKKYENTGWGQEELVITDEEIEALKQGKILGHHDGKYTHIIKYKGGNTNGK